MGRRTKKKYGYTSILLRRRKRRLLFFAGVFVLAPVLAVACYVLSRDAWGMLDREKLSYDALSLTVCDQNDQVVSTLYDEQNRLLTDIDALPEHVKNAFIAAEDARFYSHPGVDVIRILGAAWSDIKAGSFVEGASTITQQLIKLTHLNSRKEISRKVDEAILALELERKFGKDEILEMYLNTVYFGGGYYGIETAARGYFGVAAKDLSLDQAALLAGVLKSPSRFAPHLRPEASVGRRGVILDLMAEYGMITEAEAASAKLKPLVLNKDAAFDRRGYYVDLALLESCETLSITMTELLNGGYRIYTAMDEEMQSLCETLFADDSYFPYVNGESAQGALCIVDAKNGYVSALIGGRDEDVALAYNRAVRIRRQPGSVIKPILVYAPALEAGYTAADTLLDEETVFDDYAPSNANGRYSGWVTMREAVTRSLNIPAVDLFSRLGIGYCKAFARRLGITFSPQDTRLALALGGFTYGVSPCQLSAAYASFASGGIYRKPVLIRRIEDKDGNILYENASAGQRVMSEGNAFILTSMLMSVAQSGTARTLSSLEMEIAAKTGTVGDETGNRDIWLAAYTSDYAAVVWMGFDDNAEGKLIPADQGGGGSPANLLRDVFSAVYAGKAKPVFSVPASVIRVRLDGYTLSSKHEAVLATALTPGEYGYWEYFVRGTEPKEVSAYWSTPEPPRDLSLSKAGNFVTLKFTPLYAYVRYLLYREDSDGYSLLLASFEGETDAVSYTDDVSECQGTVSYYVIPVHPSLTVEGAPLSGEPSERVSTVIFRLKEAANIPGF